MKTRAIRITGPCRMEFGEAEIPDPEEGEVRIRNGYTCVSPGTELRVYKGEQEGRGLCPFIPGYAAVGVVEAAGRGVALEEGTVVFHTGTRKADCALLWGGHCGHAVTTAAQTIPLPDGVDPLEASAARLGAIAYHGARLSRPQNGETVAVVGLGPIGQASARIHARSGTRVMAVDRVQARVELARRHGIDARMVVGSLRETLADLLNERGADIVVDATGSKEILPQSIELARDPVWDKGKLSASRFLLQASYVGDVPIPYLEAFRKELTILIPRADHPDDIRAVLRCLAEKQIALRDLISDVRHPDEAEKTYRELLEHPESLVTVAFNWE